LDKEFVEREFRTLLLDQWKLDSLILFQLVDRKEYTAQILVLTILWRLEEFDLDFFIFISPAYVLY